MTEFIRGLTLLTTLLAILQLICLSTMVSKASAECPLKTYGCQIPTLQSELESTIHLSSCTLREEEEISLTRSLLAHTASQLLSQLSMQPELEGMEFPLLKALQQENWCLHSPTQLPPTTLPSNAHSPTQQISWDWGSLLTLISLLLLPLLPLLFLAYLSSIKT